MIPAALHGKLSCISSEDALTAVVFGGLRYLPSSVLAEWVNSAQGTAENTRILWPEGSPKVDFWPRGWKDVRRGQGIVEPDVLLGWAEFHVVVEAKLWSGKSQLYEQGEDEDSYEPVDQLAREWEAALFLAQSDAAFRPRALIYLTRHLSVPRDELAGSHAELLKRGIARPPIYWLSWSALEEPLRREAREGDHPAAAIAAEVLEYLDSVGVLRFSGWGRVPAPTGESWQYAGDSERPYFMGLSLRAPTWQYESSGTRYLDVRKPTTPNWSYEGGSPK